MAEASNLLEKYSGAAAGDPASLAEFHSKIASYKPEWEKHEATKGSAQMLKHLHIDDTVKTKALLMSNLDYLKILLDGLSSLPVELAQWIVTILYDLLREDAGCYNMFEEAMKAKIPVYDCLMKVLSAHSDPYVISKTSWILTAVMGNTPRFFAEAQVIDVVNTLKVSAPVNEDRFDAELPILEAITNLMKAGAFRAVVWGQPGVKERVFSVNVGKASSPYLYKTVFAVWMLSFDPAIMTSLKSEGDLLVGKIKDILGASRVEKVVRLCLTVLKNFLGDKALCEDIVEDGILEIVQQLEFEKWRDAELYDEIRDMAQLISTEVNELSNFDRYERELHTGKLKWGFIHSTKFWAENVMKFEGNDFSAINALAMVLQNTAADPTTLAVACHDMGEFVALHPLGKKKVAQLLVKERVMELMSTERAEFREVRREALLCCQKLMLNKWQDLDVNK